jgi:hypothetical protein
MLTTYVHEKPTVGERLFAIYNRSEAETTATSDPLADTNRLEVILQELDEMMKSTVPK